MTILRSPGDFARIIVPSGTTLKLIKTTLAALVAADKGKHS